MAKKDNWEKVEMSPTWDYEENKTLIGVFVQKEEGVGPNESNLYTIETKDGERLGVWGSTVLDTRFKNIQIGEEVKIVYKGLVKSKQRKGAEYHDFDLFHRPSSYQLAKDEFEFDDEEKEK